MANLFQRHQNKAPLLEAPVASWMGPVAPWAAHEVRPYNADRARNWVVICAIVSMVLHFLIFIVPWPKNTPPIASNPDTAAAHGPLHARLSIPHQHTEPEPQKETPRKPQPETPRQDVVHTNRPPTRERPSVPPPPPIPQPNLKPSQPEAPTDMAGDIHKHRADHGEVDPLPDGAGQPDAADGEDPMSRIKNNIQAAMDKNSRTKGVNGMFSFKVGVCTAHVQFNGRRVGTGEPINAAGTIPGDVDVCPSGDVRAAVVKKELEYIHRYYTGNFMYESARFGRFIPMSGAPEHASELEAFVTAETNYILDRQSRLQ